MELKVNNKESMIKINFAKNDLKNIHKFDKDTFFSDDTKVKDIMRYTISENNSSLTLKPFEGELKKEYKFIDKDVSLEDCEKSVVIILESPHKDEYSYNNGKLTPLSPANGSTGERIKKTLIDVLCCSSCYMALPDLCETKLIICNPIQWQTSMHFFYKNRSAKLNTEIRDRVWKDVWKIKEIRENFQKRLEYYNPCLIINACTGGTKQDSLNSIIREYLNAKLPKVKKFSCFHPSHPAWNNNPFGINI